MQRAFLYLSMKTNINVSIIILFLVVFATWEYTSSLLIIIVLLFFTMLSLNISLSLLLYSLQLFVLSIYILLFDLSTFAEDTDFFSLPRPLLILLPSLVPGFSLAPALLPPPGAGAATPWCRRSIVDLDNRLWFLFHVVNVVNRRGIWHSWRYAMDKTSLPPEGEVQPGSDG